MPLLTSLLLGSILSLCLAVGWDYVFESDEEAELKELRIIAQKKPEFQIYLNGVEIFNKAQVKIPLESKIPELKFSAWNIGNSPADGIMACFTYPSQFRIIAGAWSNLNPPSYRENGHMHVQGEFGHIAQRFPDLVPIGYGFTFPNIIFDVPNDTVTRLWASFRVWSKDTQEATYDILIIFVPGFGKIEVDKAP